LIIADTGPLVAVANERDDHHAECTELLETRLGPILVPAPVVVEVCQLLESRKGSDAEAAFLASIASGELTVADLTREQYARAAELVKRYADMPLGAVDACVVAVAETHNVTNIATLDHRHFRVVRPAHVDAFTLLP
jgi:predicted nucleic acid-binding protein